MTRPHPDLWYPIAALLSALRKLLRGADPYAFAALAREARTQLIVITALIRRYLHILAAEIILPPPRAASRTGQPSAPREPARRDSLFALFEIPRASTGRSAGEDPPELQWALLTEAVRRLVSVLANPDPHARRLARRFGTLTVPGLRDLPIPGHIIRQIHPALDTFINQVDALARPQAWAGLDTS